MSEKVTKSFTITASPAVMKRFERFLALLHYNSGWGHSANFVMPLDGDGSDRFRVHDFKPGYHKDVEHIGSVGYGFEIALDDAYTTRDGVATPRHYLAKNGQLLRDGEVIKPRNDEASHD